MKKIFLFLTIAVFLMTLTACTSLTKSQFSSPLHSDVRAPIKADVTIGEKISGTASTTTIFKIFKFGSTRKYATGVAYFTNGGFGGVDFDPFALEKEAAAYDAVNTSNADVIVNPEYLVEVNDYLLFSTAYVTVTGLKGTLRGLKVDDPAARKAAVVTPEIKEAALPKEVVAAPKVEAKTAPQEVAAAPEAGKSVPPPQVVVAPPATDNTLSQAGKPKEIPSALKEEIPDFISKWLESWEVGDMKTYGSCYASDFNSKGMNLKNWIAYKTNIHRKSKHIKISLDNLQISVEGNKAAAEFIQHYSSSIFKDTGKKKLELIKVNDEWKIYKEVMQ